jgi:hypothetical protein
VLQDLLIGRVRAAHYDCALNLTVLGWKLIWEANKRFGRVWAEVPTTLDLQREYPHIAYPLPSTNDVLPLPASLLAIRHRKLTLPEVPPSHFQTSYSPSKSVSSLTQSDSMRSRGAQPLLYLSGGPGAP